MRSKELHWHFRGFIVVVHGVLFTYSCTPGFIHRVMQRVEPSTLKVMQQLKHELTSFRLNKLFQLLLYFDSLSLNISLFIDCLTACVQIRRSPHSDLAPQWLYTVASDICLCQHFSSRSARSKREKDPVGIHSPPSPSTWSRQMATLLFQRIWTSLPRVWWYLPRIFAVGSLAIVFRRERAANKLSSNRRKDRRLCFSQRSCLWR